ncbi:hypothetical protein Acr_08g0008640 [Actinidia rufa]|uniref:Uncharacterized protein n=1 Tax=Actinidia rufa TaxID=165716 RepID=A0A7J0F1A2_9ERIC|nr:hypothetical protein Acr_08g0008640 [Actinidia rufa]
MGKTIGLCSLGNGRVDCSTKEEKIAKLPPLGDLIPPVTRVIEGPSGVQSTWHISVSQGGLKGKQVVPDNIEAESRSDNRTIVSGELHDLMSKVEIFAQLADDIRQVERAIGSSSKGNGKLKHLKSTGDREDRVRQGINIVFKESIFKLLTLVQTRRTTESPPAWEMFQTFCTYSPSN